MTRAETKREILRIAQALDQAGMMPSKSGNVSARDGKGFIITPAGLAYARSSADDLVATAMDGKVMGKAAHRPSSEWRLHAAIYAARPEVMAVVHTHSPRATALSCARKGIPPLHYMVLLAGGPIACADHATAGTQALAENALSAMAGRRAALLANHGVVATGETLAGAHALALEVENLAGQYLDLLAAGLKPMLLTEAELAQAAAHFAGYGRG
ncbi:MAG: class II aldolase/adducin family protein [Roseomonas sp.]|nr:class II aldolase/adducin family protein [Roseomonas sp.]MCA3274436.1 class II aldolase/adducin family protein [Roseomonas sp.]MCA3282794.1 class II aldolase/adducin family protein [Roseomonas sp.]MCA3285676.1 class II aldolase/adducin family protein [Roseomonas sp.]MCA3289957.1 class II aldolase/adducin family protein [Roseomonas sp.]